MKHTPINTIAILFITLTFVGIVLFFLIYINQQEAISEQQPDIFLREETVLEIDQPQREIPPLEVKREGYSPDDKPFPDDNYLYDYDERTVDFRLVCIKPCPVSKEVLDQEFAAIAYAISTARGLTQSDIDKELLPFEVHASEDEICPFSENALAYMSIFTDSNWHTRGKLCFFFDRLHYNRDKFPYSTSIHEVIHLFEYNKVPHDYGEGGSVLWEGISEMIESFFLKGNERDSFCWQGNAWYKTVLQNSNDAHWVGGDLFFELCRQYGFDYKDLPVLFDQLEARNGNVNVHEFVTIINDIVGKDTSHLFQQAEVI